MSSPFACDHDLGSHVPGLGGWPTELPEWPSDGDGCVRGAGAAMHTSCPLGGCTGGPVDRLLEASMDPLDYVFSAPPPEPGLLLHGGTPWESHQDLDGCASASFGAVARTFNYTPQEAYRILEETALRRTPPTPPALPCEPQQRFRWTAEFTEAILCAYKYLGPRGAKPKPVLALVREALPDLRVTRQQVESRLQKVRLSLRRAYGLSPTESLDSCHVPRGIDGERYRVLKGLWDRNRAGCGHLGPEAH